MNAVRASAWRALADARDLPLSDAHLRHPELHAMPPEVAAVRMLRWADNLKHGRYAGGRWAGGGRRMRRLRVKGCGPLPAQPALLCRR
jgi:hypothetical protein